MRGTSSIISRFTAVKDGSLVSTTHSLSTQKRTLQNATDTTGSIPSSISGSTAHTYEQSEVINGHAYDSGSPKSYEYKITTFDGERFIVVQSKGRHTAEHRCMLSIKVKWKNLLGHCLYFQWENKPASHSLFWPTSNSVEQVAEEIERKSLEMRKKYRLTQIVAVNENTQVSFSPSSFKQPSAPGSHVFGSKSNTVRVPASEDTSQSLMPPASSANVDGSARVFERFTEYEEARYVCSTNDGKNFTIKLFLLPWGRSNWSTKVKEPGLSCSFENGHHGMNVNKRLDWNSIKLPEGFFITDPYRVSMVKGNIRRCCSDLLKDWSEAPSEPAATIDID